MARQVTKIGNLTRDPVLRFSNQGTPWATFGIAVTPYDPKTKSRDKDNPVFYEVKCFRQLAEHAAESLQKGDRVIVNGDGEVEEWEDKETKEPRSRKVILCNNLGAELRFNTVQVDRTTRKSRPLDDDEPSADRDDDF